MSTGDVSNPKRVRFQANERLDTVDTDPLSSAAREHLDAYGRAVEVVPRNVGASTPTGIILQGFGLTLNPINPTDAKVRVQSALGVAFDANGRLLIKESGVQVDLTLSAGNSQIYVYYVDTASDTAIRRAISVSPPFTESPQAMQTKFAAGVSFFVRAGDQTSIVASDTVNGATTALCFLGVANNSGGVVTMTGYNATTAPNGAFATNRLTTVSVPSTLPVLNTSNGSVATMHGLINAALWLVGQAFWKGSKNFTPSAANNFGAFSLPTVGIDGLFDDQSETTFAPITRWRDWQQDVRYLVDHQGYPGGQISVRDENWVDASGTVHVDPTAGFLVAGAPTVNVANGGTAQLQLSTSTDQWAIPLSLPYGAVVKSIVVSYSSGSGTSTLTVALKTILISTNAVSTQVSRTVTTATGNGQSFDVMVTPTSGHGPKVVRATERLQLNVTCSDAAAQPIVVKDVQVSFVLPPVGWAPFLVNTDAATANGDQVTFDDPVAGLNQRNAHLATVGVASTSGGQAQVDQVHEVFVDDDIAHATEFMLRTGAVVDGPNACRVNFIWNMDNGDHWGIQRNEGDANWKLKMSDDVNDQSIDTGVAFASNTVYRFKLDYQGKNRNSSGSPRARLWINGALVATVTAISTISAAPAGMQLQLLTLTSVSGPYDVRFGRIHRAWNHLAAGDNV